MDPQEVLRERAHELRVRADRRHLIILGCIAALAVIFRMRNLSAAPFWIDESYSAWAARNYLAGEGFSDPAGPSSPYRRGWLTTSLPIAASFSLFGVSEFAARLPMVVYGLLTVGVAYLLGAHFHRLAGYMLATFVAVDPFFVVWSRTARMYAPLTFFYLASLYVVLRWQTRQDLSFRCPHPYALAGLVVLGMETHRAYLGFGAVVCLFFGVTFVSRVWSSDERTLAALDGPTRRSGALFIGAIVVAAGFLLVRGVPAVLTTQPSGAWPERGPMYYWSYLGQTYIFLPYLGVVGAVYLWVRNRAARLLVLGFVVPFLVASITPRKAPRFVVHLMPVLGAVVFIPVADGLRYLWQRITADADGVDRTDLAVAAVGPVLILAVVAVPLAGFAVADSPYDPPHQPERSDWEKASEFVAAESEDDPIIVSTRPELSMWYFGETDYFFRQNSLGAVAKADGEYVHPRTDTVFLNETTDIRRLLQQDREIWLFAGKKFDEAFTSEEAKQLVQEEFVRRGDRSWVNMKLYYHGPE